MIDLNRESVERICQNAISLYAQGLEEGLDPADAQESAGVIVFDRLRGEEKALKALEVMAARTAWRSPSVYMPKEVAIELIGKLAAKLVEPGDRIEVVIEGYVSPKAGE